MTKKFTYYYKQNSIYETLKPPAFNKFDYPLCEMDDRAFEILLYRIFQERINHNDELICLKHDSITLMSGVGEKGRDSILTLKGVNTGVIQCKRYNSNFSESESCKEIIKFCMYSLVDTSIIGDKNNFHYYLCVSKGFTNTANVYLADFNNKITKESKIDEWICEIINEYKSLQLFFDLSNLDDIKIQLHAILSHIKIIPIIASDINNYINKFEQSIANNFFQIKIVTDNSVLLDSINNVINTYLQPILVNFKSPTTSENKNYSVQFSEYIGKVLEKYSIPRTIVFGNIQKKLEQYYYPLTVESNDNKKEKIKINGYEENFIPKYRKIIIVDTGGMGKSTIMKWLFLNSIKEKKGIPFFLELTSINKQNLLFNEIKRQFENYTSDEVSLLELRKILSTGEYIFFLDGLDEVKDDIDIVIKDINEFILSVSPLSSFIVTSRPDKYTKSLNGFQEFKIQKLKKNEIFEFIKLISENNPKGDRLINTLKLPAYREVLNMAVTPLLASLLYKKYDYKETIPFKKTEFFYEIYDALFESHDLTKDSLLRPKKSNLSQDNFLRILCMIGYLTVLQNEGIEYTKEKIISILEEVKKYYNHLNFDIESFLYDSITAVPFFYMDGQNFKWIHKLFQEYYASLYIYRELKGRQEDTIMNIYKSRRLRSLTTLLDFYYDLDYMLFRNVLMKGIILDFFKFYEQNKNRFNLPEELNDKLIEVLFSYNFILYSNELEVNEDLQNDPFFIADQLRAKYFPNEKLNSGTLRSNIADKKEVMIFAFSNEEQEKVRTIAQILLTKGSCLFSNREAEIHLSKKLSNIIIKFKEFPFTNKNFEIIQKEGIEKEFIESISDVIKISKTEAQKVMKEINETSTISNEF